MKTYCTQNTHRGISFIFLLFASISTSYLILNHGLDLLNINIGDTYYVYAQYQYITLINVFLIVMGLSTLWISYGKNRKVLWLLVINIFFVTLFLIMNILLQMDIVTEQPFDINTYDPKAIDYVSRYRFSLIVQAPIILITALLYLLINLISKLKQVLIKS
ncbi:hypothetical protein JCM19314_1130 [Nonlabens ulvanivorans]|uniref:Uncharacterized protein n=1 Tax=Nonlabens ulvanivorans TaxID=906888 RepID=A0A090QAE9_NONUL|nr:hypothetical protein JCM19314_1130 [Nonlabens ulvanivorans]